MSQVAGFVQSAILIVPVVAVPALAMFGPPAGSERYQRPDDLQLEDTLDESFDDGFKGDLGFASEADSIASAFDKKSNNKSDKNSGDATRTVPPLDFELTNARTEIEHAGRSLTGSNAARSLDEAAGAAGADRLFASLDTPAEPPRRNPKANKKSESPEWNQAIARLRAHGVERFLLTEGSEPGSFYFTCGLPPQGPQRMIRRFEAEAGEPIAAVSDVLAQIEDFARQ